MSKEAVEASIEKWRKNSRVRKIESARMGPDECPLCQIYLDDHRCKGCPVMKKTKIRFCQGTPYQGALEARFLGVKAFRKAAKRELEFLESLR